VKILIDTDILLDVALGRSTFVSASSQVLHWAELNPGHAAVAWHSLSNIAYLVKPDARPFLKGLLEFVEVAPVETKEATQAMSLSMPDLEDALQAVSALAFRAVWLVTRNVLHYKRSPVPYILPEEFCRKHAVKS
jgi:predicted nucleic acid-binding protein